MDFDALLYQITKKRRQTKTRALTEKTINFICIVDGVVVSLSYHGCIKVWTLENLDNKANL